MSKLMTIGQLSREVGYSPEWLRQLERRGVVRPTRVGRVRVFDETDKARVVAYRNRRTTTAPATEGR